MIQKVVPLSSTCCSIIWARGKLTIEQTASTKRGRKSSLLPISDVPYSISA
ncbi:MAG: hypothetical protein J6R86_01990 [Lentisphaeria bacterium]|nr:hypothetical protein [Lentisphaeria bacterium]